MDVAKASQELALTKKRLTNNKAFDKLQALFEVFSVKGCTLHMTKINLFIFAASPIDNNQIELNYQREVSAIQNRARQHNCNNLQIEVIEIRNATLDDLEQKIASCNARDINIVHIIAHGNDQSIELFGYRTIDAVIYERIAEKLRESRDAIAIIFLNVCESSKGGSYLSSTLGCITLCYSGKVSDNAAIEVADRFYNRYFSNFQQVCDAVTEVQKIELGFTKQEPPMTVEFFVKRDGVELLPQLNRTTQLLFGGKNLQGQESIRAPRLVRWFPETFITYRKSFKIRDSITKMKVGEFSILVYYLGNNKWEMFKDGRSNNISLMYNGQEINCITSSESYRRYKHIQIAEKRKVIRAVLVLAVLVLAMLVLTGLVLAILLGHFA